MARRSDGRGLGRRRAFRDPIPSILVLCEGEVTEPEYIDAFRREHANRLVRVEVYAPGGDPKAIVAQALERRAHAEQEAKRARDENLKFDEVWCVVDADEHARLADALRAADANGIKVALSNPCFELWLLLHFADQTGFLTVTEARRLLRRHVRDYDKHVRFADFRDGYLAAVGRAKHLEERHENAGTEGGNPCTGVHRLTERIRRFGRDERHAGE